MQESHRQMTQELPGRSSRRLWRRNFLVVLLSLRMALPLMHDMPAAASERGMLGSLYKKERGSNKGHSPSHQSMATGPSLHQKTELTQVMHAGLNLCPARSSQKLNMGKDWCFFERKMGMCGGGVVMGGCDVGVCAECAACVEYRHTCPRVPR